MQCCPTLSPFATCGDKGFKCGDRQLLRNGFLIVKSISNSDKSGDSKAFVATIVANVATESMWLDITDLMDSRLFEKFQLINAVLEQKLVLHSTD